MMMKQDLSVAGLITEVNPVYYKGDLTTCRSDWYYDNIVLDYDKFHFILDGECTIRINGVDHTARPGQLFLIPCHSTQSYYTDIDKTVTQYWFHCSLPCREKDVTELIRLPYVIDVKDVSCVETLFKNVLGREKETGLTARLDQKADIIRLLSYYIHLSDNVDLNVCSDSRISSIISYMEEHLSEKITLGMLSDMLNFHPNYFIRLFKAITGAAPMEYLYKLRLAAARRLLLEGSVTVQDAGVRVGFDNPHYFSRYFKKMTGLSPTEYQRIAIAKHTSKGIAGAKRMPRPDS